MSEPARPLATYQDILDAPPNQVAESVYGEQGVAYLWFVNMRTHLLEAFKNEEGRWLLQAAFSDKEEVRVEPFDAEGLPLNELRPPELPADQG